jgi:phosphoribosylformylglycinamidine (FGAM) synthase PurS component
MHNYITYDTLFETVKNSLKKCIQKNEEDIRIYKSTMFKIDKYNKELEEILSLKNSIENAIKEDSPETLI